MTDLKKLLVFVLAVKLITASSSSLREATHAAAPQGVAATEAAPHAKSVRVISRSDYADKLYGFWLGACVANWTGLVTEMDKVGVTADLDSGPFYTREDWGKPDQPNIWSKEPSPLSPTIDFVLRGRDEGWGADDSEEERS